MRIISFVTQKGGSGKTTLALSCAVAAAESGARVLVLDMDPQGTAEEWYMQREKDTPLLARIDQAELDSAAKRAASAGMDLLIIDTQGHDDPGAAAAARAADFCLIPCRPSPADMKATPPTVETLRRLNKPFAFVLTQTPPRSYRIREAAQGLSVLGMVAPVNIVIRNTYQDAFGRGLGVTEFEPEGKAAEEIRALWQWVETKLGKASHGKQKARIA